MRLPSPLPFCTCHRTYTARKAIGRIRTTLFGCLTAVLCLQAQAASTFGLTTAGDYYVVDTGADLSFKVMRKGKGSSLRGIGDIISLRYKGIEYQDATKGSHINSGFGGLYDGAGTPRVQASQVDADHVRITVQSGNLIHYYMASRNDPSIHMATWFSSEPKLGLVRFIVRIPYNRLPHGIAAADLHGQTRTVEASDVFGLPNGETRSKHYANMRLKDWQYFGATGNKVGVWVVRDSNEGNSGGPFYRSLLDQGTADQELTYIVNYGEAQTEAFRTGILNRYTLTFTNGRTPASIDTSWISRMGLKGFVTTSGRGRVEGQVTTELDSALDYTVGLSGTSGQFWTDVDTRTGRFGCDGVLPGHYTLTLYRHELEVAHQPVDVTAGQRTVVPAVVANDPEQTPAVWRIGHWDGSPRELLNGDKVTSMHPSDIRMADWRTAPFSVGHSTAGKHFPAFQWKGVNNDLHIHFTLDQQPTSPLTLRIGITDAFSNGRPTIAINGWSPAVPKASVQPSSRTLTVGTYRGNNTTYHYTIPANALKAGTNDLTLRIVSGNGGDRFLSPGVSYDAIDLLDTAH